MAVHMGVQESHGNRDQHEEMEAATYEARLFSRDNSQRNCQYTCESVVGMILSQHLFRPA